MNPEENTQPVQPAQAPAQPVESTPSAEPKAEVVENVQSAQTEEKPVVAETPVAQPTQATTATPTANASTTTYNATPVAGEKKSKAGLIIAIVIVIVLALLTIGGILIYKGITTVVDKIGDGTSQQQGGDKNENPESGRGESGNGQISGNDSSAVAEAYEKMRNELTSYNYTATITTSMSGMADMSFDTVMDCTYDNTSKIEYCKTTTLMGLTTEQYYDWGNGMTYSKASTPFAGFGDVESWNSVSITSDNVSMATIGEGVDVELVSSSNGFSIYKGKIEMSRLTGADIDGEGQMDMEITINDSGYIDQINFNMASSMEEVQSEVTAVIEYSDFGTAPKLSIPAEAL